ncbi:sugar transferase [Rubinisphaera sp. ICM_H10]|nr:sugar transferase [Rubinisphaera margarita]
MSIPQRIHSKEAFASLLHVERMRSDRSGRPFCLVSMDQRQHSENAEALNVLLEVLNQRIRATDHAGFLGRYEVGVALWDTNPQGARTFIEALLEQIAAEHRPRISIFAYPENRDDDDDGDEAGGLPESPSPFDQQETEPQDREQEQTTSALASCAESPAGNAERHSSLNNESHYRVQSLTDFYVRSIPLWKRSLDVVGSGLGLIVLSPFLLCCAMSVKLTSPGPILFYQDRTGLGGRRFKMIKFRSMIVDAENRKQSLMTLNEQDGPAFKMEADPRITPVGRFLRAFSIDELPQLWNVFRGDMTLVGPRPLPCAEADACEIWQRRRLDVTPGLTCIWQVKDRRNKIPFSDWVRMDLDYINRRTLAQDMCLILQTVRVVLRRRGI